MFDVIDFLESVGRDAQLRYASSEEVVALLAGRQADLKFSNAILAQDTQGLGAMLGKGSFCCYVNPAREDEDEDEKDDEGKDDEGGKRSSEGPEE